MLLVQSQIYDPGYAIWIENFSFYVNSKSELKFRVLISVSDNLAM